MSLRTTATLICTMLAGTYLLARGPLFASIVFALLTVGVFASLRFGAWVRHGTIGAGIVGLFLIFPSSTGDRSNPETSAIGALTEIRSAEMAYNAMTGHFDNLECLVSMRCLPVSNGEPALRPELSGADPWRGYRFVFHGGPAPEGRLNTDVSRTAAARFAVIAVPTDARAASRRSFCTDDTGSIYITPSGAVPRVQSGRCLDTSRPLQ